MQTFLQELTELLPKGRLTIKKLGYYHRAFPFWILYCLLSLGFAVFFIWFSLNDISSLKKEYEISQNMIVMEEADIQGACKTKFLVLRRCNGTVTENGKTWEVNFRYLDFSLDNKDVHINAVRAATNPDLVSVDLAIEHLPERAFGLLLFVIWGIYYLLQALYLIPKYFHSNKKLALDMEEKQPWKFTLQPVKVSKFSLFFAYDASIIYYTGKQNGTELQKVKIMYRSRKNELIAFEQNGECLGLMMTSMDNKYHIPVTLKLSNFNLTKQEKQILLDKINEFKRQLLAPLNKKCG